jgi:hypothetical protein
VHELVHAFANPVTLKLAPLTDVFDGGVAEGLSLLGDGSGSLVGEGEEQDLPPARRVGVVRRACPQPP